MSTPLERLTTIISSYTPTIVKFKFDRSHSLKNTLHFDSVVVKESESIPPPEDIELFELMKGHLSETWVQETEQYVMNATVDSLWRMIVNGVASRYEKNSARCTATRRKTSDFICKIKIDDKLLASFLLQTFIKVHSSDYKAMLTKDREALFEQFDSLRRTFGKRV